MKALFLALVLGLLICDASGVTALVSPEACTALGDAAPDGKCPPLCARCACAVPTVVPPIAAASSVVLPCADSTIAYTSVTIDAPPHEILHVPR